jgi:hypothetical protein
MKPAWLKELGLGNRTRPKPYPPLPTLTVGAHLDHMNYLEQLWLQISRHNRNSDQYEPGQETFAQFLSRLLLMRRHYASRV